MSSLATSAPTSKGMLWTGRILSGLIVALMLFAASFGFLKPEMSRQGMKDMGYPDSVGDADHDCDARVHLAVCDSSHQRVGCNSADGLFRRSDRDPCEARGTGVRVGAFDRGLGVAGNLFARRAAARATAATHLTQRFVSLSSSSRRATTRRELNLRALLMWPHQPSRLLPPHSLRDVSRAKCQESAASRANDAKATRAQAARA